MQVLVQLRSLLSKLKFTHFATCGSHSYETRDHPEFNGRVSLRIVERFKTWDLRKLRNLRLST